MARSRSIQHATLDDGTPIQLVDAADGPIQIEHYIDEDPQHPDAWMRFLSRMATFRKDYSEWQTAVMDSVTFMELAARKHSQYILKPKTKEPRQWFADSTDSLEEMLMLSFGSFRLNVVVCAHVDEDKDEVNGMFVRNPSAPGRMRKRSPAGFSELYHSYVGADERGERQYLLQTRSDRLYNCSSQIEAADPSWPRYADLWTGWPTTQDRPWLHVLNYGDSGSGKSTFAATFPKPMIVFMWDPLGKEMPYLKAARS